MKQTFQEIELTKLQPSLWNPRKTFSGPEFDDLVASVREKGIIEPILARPLDKGNFEIVFGERRFKAAVKVAQEGGEPDGMTIPVIVRELDDDQAFDLMTIENLQRSDLTELEEARSFKAYVDRHGDDGIPELANRIGKKATYIYKRVFLLRLPENILNAWGKGLIKYGHVEQLARLKDKKQILELFKDVTERNTFRGEVMNVQRLKDEINDKVPRLKDAKFDPDKAGCLKCDQNSDMQKDLLGDVGDMGKAHCLMPKCFKQKQNNWLIKNWKKTGYARNFGTNGFRFAEDIGFGEFQAFWKKPGKDCLECKDFVTVLTLSGAASQQRACIGDEDCFHKTTKEAEVTAREQVKSKKQSEPEAKTWHGEHFREQFYHEQIPLRMKEVGPREEKAKRLILASLLHSNDELKSWFGCTYMGKKVDDTWDRCWVDNDEMWQALESMKLEQIEEILKEAALKVALQRYFGSATRHLVGMHLGSDLASEWRINEEYLDKKTIKEILALGEKFEIFADKKAKDFLYEKLNKKRGKFTNCKKTELKSIFLESGVDLAGKVPEEILKVE